MHLTALLLFIYLVFSEVGSASANGSGGGLDNSSNPKGGNGKLHFTHVDRKRKDKENCFIIKVRDEATLDKKKALFDLTEGSDGKLFMHALNGFAKCNCQLAQLRHLAEDDDIDFIEEDIIMKSYAFQNTGQFWHLDRIDQLELPLDGMFNYQYTGQGVEIYILDTGVNGNHSDFTNRTKNGVDIIGGGLVNPYSDRVGHGSHCAGLAAGTQSGVAKRATIVSVRVMGSEGGTMTATIQGIEWVLKQPARPSRGVINLSLGNIAEEFTTAMNDAVSRAVDNGFVVVAAAGNEIVNACTVTPASAPKAITVASVGPTDSQSWFSNYGPCVDIFAPGEDIYSASGSNDTFKRNYGTSMACAVVSGIAAAYLSAYPNLSAEEIKQHIIMEATPNVRNLTEDTPNRLVKIPGLSSFESRSPSNSPASPSPSQSPVSASPSPLFPAPPNDFCSNAIALPCGTFAMGTTKNANFKSTAECCSITHTAAEVWYSVYVPTDGRLVASLCKGASWDTKLTLWNGTCPNNDLTSLTCVAANDDFPPCFVRSVINITVKAGPYYLMVHGYESFTGNFNLSLTCPDPSPSASPTPPIFSTPPTASLSPLASASPFSPSPEASFSTSPLASTSPSPEASYSTSPVAPTSPYPSTCPPCESSLITRRTSQVTPAACTSDVDPVVRAALYWTIGIMWVLFGFVVGVGLTLCFAWFCMWPRFSSSIQMLQSRSDSIDTTTDAFPTAPRGPLDDSETAQDEALLTREETTSSRRMPFQGLLEQAQSSHFIAPTRIATTVKSRQASGLQNNDDGC